MLIIPTTSFVDLAISDLAERAIAAVVIVNFSLLLSFRPVPQQLKILSYGPLLCLKEKCLIFIVFSI